MKPEPKGHTRRSMLRRGSLLGAGALMAGTGLGAAMEAPAAANTVLVGGLQPGWRYCHKCKGLFYGVAGNGVCPAGGGHDRSLSNKYQLFFDIVDDGYNQDGWRWCRKCQGLAFGESTGVCPAPGPGHDYNGSFDYNIFHVSDGNERQGGWAHCKNCQAMHYALAISQSRCPRTGGNHIIEGSIIYYWLDMYT